MAIKPIDLQVMIPKLPEVQKERNASTDILKNNMAINMHKEQQQYEKDTKQVFETKKTHGARIEREGQRKGRQGNKEKEQKEERSGDKDNQTKETSVKRLNKIDIRI